MAEDDEVGSFLARFGGAKAATRAAVDEAAFLRAFGQRLRRARQEHRMPRRLLAAEAGVSERYLAMAEAGEANISLLVLRGLARALGAQAADLLGEGQEEAVAALLARLDPAQLAEAQALLARRFFTPGAARRSEARIALLGAEGAGKTTLGRRLAEARGVPFVELDEAVARAASGELRSLARRFGDDGLRRVERRVLEGMLRQPGPVVIAIGPGIVAAPASLNLLLRNCHTIWLRAGAEALLRRRAGPGAPAPSRVALGDLDALLTTLEPMLARADAILDTSELTPEQGLAALQVIAEKD
jgi:XRE family transcriptional regulator, aerobic/anaerobic benzoate catabolism transcriptional regulator